MLVNEVTRMSGEFTAIIEEDKGWFIGYCPEIRGANGQGRTLEECRANLADAIELILEDRRDDAFRGCRLKLSATLLSFINEAGLSSSPPSSVWLLLKARRERTFAAVQSANWRRRGCTTPYGNS